MADTDDAREVLESARCIQADINNAGLGPSARSATEATGDRLGRFDESVTFEPLRTASRQLFADGHFARAVEEGFKALNNAVKEKSGTQFADGDALMRTVFSANQPILKFNDFQTVSQKDEQRGYMDMFAGAMTGIRNPRAHEHELGDEPESALEMLTMANHLLRKLEGSKRTRRRKKGSS